jgi:hypothetical protein
MPIVSLSNPLDFKKITCLYLYGQDTVPDIYENRLRSTNAPTIVVDVDSSFWSGPGRYATPALCPFVQSFFSSLASLPMEVQQLYATRFAAQGNVGPVQITVSDLILLAGVPASQFRFSFAQYGFGTNTSDYAARTYIYNNEGFSLSPSDCKQSECRSHREGPMARLLQLLGVTLKMRGISAISTIVLCSADWWTSRDDVSCEAKIVPECFRKT